MLHNPPPRTYCPSAEYCPPTTHPQARPTAPRAHAPARGARAAAARAEERRRQEEQRRRAIFAGTSHDPRADCLAGNGVMSELGVGDELFRPEDGDFVEESQTFNEKDSTSPELRPDSRARSPSDQQLLQSKPIVVIKNFATKRGQDAIIAVIAKWTASLVQGGIAHVIVVSDNRENAKLLAQGECTIMISFGCWSQSSRTFSSSFETSSCHSLVRCRLLKCTLLRRAETPRNQLCREILIR